MELALITAKTIADLVALLSNAFLVGLCATYGVKVACDRLNWKPVNVTITNVAATTREPNGVVIVNGPVDSKLRRD